MLRQKTKYKYLKFLFLSFFLIGIDQVSKIYVVGSSFPQQFNKLYILGLVGINNYLYIFLLTVFLLISIKEFLKSSKTSQIIYVFIFSGIFSQFISRIYFGGVVDFINILNITVINIADLYIVIGVFTLLLLKKY